MAKRKHKVGKTTKAGKPYNPTPRRAVGADTGVNYYADLAAEYDDPWWDYVGGKYGKSYWDCHKGNSKVLSSSKGRGGTLFIGGWSRGAYHSDDMAVFDLTGGKVPLKHDGAYYAVNVDDFCVPQWSLFFWESLAMTVYHELSQGDVLIACQGGHGRSGMIVAVVAYMLLNKRYIRIPEREMLFADPIAWVQHIHCVRAVETVSQEICIYETCLAYHANPQIENRLEAIRNKPRYTKSTDIHYEEVVADWVAEPEEADIYICPICLEEYKTMIEALMCCNTTNSVRYCPVCLTKHDLPVNAFECCRVIEPIRLIDPDEEEDLTHDG